MITPSHASSPSQEAQLAYDFELEADRVIEAIEPQRGAKMTVVCALHEAYNAGAAALRRQGEPSAMPNPRQPLEHQMTDNQFVDANEMVGSIRQSLSNSVYGAIKSHIDAHGSAFLTGSRIGSLHKRLMGAIIATLDETLVGCADVATERHSDPPAWFGREIGANIVTDGNQGATESSGDNRGSASAKKNAQIDPSASPATTETLPNGRCPITKQVCDRDCAPFDCQFQ